jgi:hypothetical protein
MPGFMKVQGVKWLRLSYWEKLLYLRVGKSISTVNGIRAIVVEVFLIIRTRRMRLKIVPCVDQVTSKITTRMLSRLKLNIFAFVQRAAWKKLIPWVYHAEMKFAPNVIVK